MPEFGHEMLFAAALNIEKPLYIKKVEFIKDNGELHIYIDFNKGARFVCSVCGKAEMPVYDSEEKTWRHINFFQYKAFIHFRTPRTNCPEHGVHLINTPWGGSRDFTLLIEAMIMQLSKCMPIKQIAELLDEHDTKIWRVIHRYVNNTYVNEDFSKVEHVGVDETASKRGHKYVTLFVDMDESKVIYATEGKGSETIKAFKEELPYHHSNPQNIDQICSDMSPSFIKGIKSNFPWADLTFDKFHVMKLMNEAVDKTRRSEQKENPLLVKSRYIWLTNPTNLKAKQKEKLENLNTLNLKTGRAYRIKLALQEIYSTATDRVDGMIKLTAWYKWACRCKIDSVKEFAKTVKSHWNGILNYFGARLTNGVLEGINSQVQAVRSRAKGYRNTGNFIAMIYLLMGKLTFNFKPKMGMI